MTDKLVTTYEAMEALDVVYNFMRQNDGGQESLIELEKIMWFVDEKQQNLDRGQLKIPIKIEHNIHQESIRNPSRSTNHEERKEWFSINTLEKLLFKCGECPYVFSSKVDASLHKERVHRNNSTKGNRPEEADVDLELDDTVTDRPKTIDKDPSMPNINKMMTVEEGTDKPE